MTKETNTVHAPSVWFTAAVLFFLAGGAFIVAASLSKESALWAATVACFAAGIGNLFAGWTALRRQNPA
jgi:membrane protein YqaA with SNARE-associated domain